MNYSNSSARLQHRGDKHRKDEEMVLTVETDRRGTHLRLRRASTLARGSVNAASKLLAMLAVSSTAIAQSFSLDVDTPSIDKWIYPFAASGGGARPTGPTFAAFGTVGTFDDRDGQYFAAFDTGATVPTGLDADSYTITSATLTLTLSFGVDGLVTYDPSYDALDTYAPGTGLPVNNDDPGRPMELYGAGYRNGLSALTVLENTGFTPNGAELTAEGVRNIFATDYVEGTARDVSNNVRDAFDTVPFAIGQVAASDLNGDGTIKAGADVTFTFNLSNPDVVDYLQWSLSVGRLSFISSSLHIASQGGIASRPEFDTKELGLAGLPARLDFGVTVVPEPTTSSVLIIAAAGLACWRNRRRLIQPADLP